MATNFPSSLDTSTTIPVESSSTPLSTNHVTAHQNIQDALEAIEAKVGVDGSAVTTSHDYKLSGVTGTDKAVSKTGSEVLTNKTLTAPVITSPTLTVGSDATGDMYYNGGSGVLTRLAKGTDNQILKMNGTAINWEAETVTVAATESVEGIGRLATAAQITAGTASEASYPLFVTPDQLALSTPVFDGSSLTGTKTKLNITSAPITQLSSTSAEETLFTYSLAGGVLSTANGIRVSGLFETNQTSGGAMTYTFRLKYGSTTIATTTIITANASQGTYSYEAYILANAATNAQRAYAKIVGLDSGGNNRQNISKGTATEDSTGALNVVLTVQASAASGTMDWCNRVIEKIV
jgi:hypothetical protein